MKKLPVRKRNRLHNYVYSKSGAYFVTICTDDHKELFGEVVEWVSDHSCHVRLSTLGEIVEKEIAVLSETYPNVFVDKYIVMPNHVHMIVIVDENRRQDAETGGRQDAETNGRQDAETDGRQDAETDGRQDAETNGRQNAAPTVTISRIIGQWKRAISIKAGFSPWQKSFHDHIIRNKNEYDKIAQYIENNPKSWENDRYHQNSSS